MKPHKTTMPRLLYSRRDAAEILGISIRSIYLFDHHRRTRDPDHRYGRKPTTIGRKLAWIGSLYNARPRSIRLVALLPTV